MGNAIALVGLLLFFSTFISVALSFGQRTSFDEFGRQGRSMALRAFGGMGLIVVGGVISGIGRQGLAGSGVILDPEKAREDQEPWTRMQGGMFADAADEAIQGISQSLTDSGLLDGIDPPPDWNPDDDLTFDEKLRRLHGLYKDGILTREEYEREKQELLESN